MPRVAVIALLVTTCAASRADDPAAAEIKTLQGEWRAVGVEFRGKTLTKDDAKAMRFEIKGRGLTFSNTQKPGRERKQTFTLDPSKTPKALDLTSLDGQEKDTTAACIYRLDGDKLTICMPYFAKDPSVRPKEFKADASGDLMLLTLERVKGK
ncbi:TIGR03067 domain-containing protein [Gemmata sp. JC673]|uniref:TIGR03067 domain-containing protein n=1 Tax=Gemmata algarum TaxID=2975278 RepID=A0ABU5EUS7_9BACT|nr:TIGR03067 domain-containing protein [Gemmata algarum]MDY3558387.1 TIGR03067 domain-containing protein [Gemmata algarum]